MEQDHYNIRKGSSLLMEKENALLSANSDERGELFSMLLRLHPIEAGRVAPGAGNQVQAAFLDMVRQSDAELAERLHTPNQRRPYTLSMLRGFHHLPPEELTRVIQRNRMVDVMPGQVYWLRVTMLDATLFGSFVQYLLMKPRSLTVRIGEAQFEMSRLLATPQSDAHSWVAYSSFAELYAQRRARRQYHFEFTSPTTFSRGQKHWGKLLTLFPTPADVFESLARQWEAFAPAHVRIEAHGQTYQNIVAWCEENVIVTQYRLETRYLPSSKFGQTGFLGEVSYEVKGDMGTEEAQWLTSLACFALFSGVGYKTAVGMGQARCIHRSEANQGTEQQREVTEDMLR